MSNSDTHIRLLQALEYLHDNGKALTQQEIAEATGIKQPNVSEAIKGNPARLTKGFLKKFAAAYSEYINADYLLDGVGALERPAKNTRPHIPMQVAAGPTGVAIDTISEAEVEHLPIIAALPEYDFTVGVKGDSMEPVLIDGDTLACRKLNDRHEIKSGKIYVLETTEGAVAKQIARYSAKGVTLHSLNPKYDDYTIAPDTVRSVSQIVGLIRPNPALTL